MLLSPLTLVLALAAPVDTATADSVPCAGASSSTVVVTISAVPGDSAADERFCAWGLDARLTGTTGARAGTTATRAPTGEIRFTRALDASAAGMSRLRASGRRVGSVTVEVPAAGSAPVRLQLTGVTVVAQHIVAALGADETDAQLVTQAADALQLEADRNEAARRLTELRALDQRKLAASFEIARAEERVKVLDARLEAARRLAQRARRQAARAGMPAEEVTLAAERADVVEAGR